VKVVVQVKPLPKTLFKTEAYSCLIELVEVGGIEPPSESARSLVLHA
jgi:hypothetical protein